MAEQFPITDAAIQAEAQYGRDLGYVTCLDHVHWTDFAAELKRLRAPAAELAALRAENESLKAVGAAFEAYVARLRAEIEDTQAKWDRTMELFGDAIVEREKLSAENAALRTNYTQARIEAEESLKRRYEVEHERDALRAENERLRGLAYKAIAVCGGCECGIAYVTIDQVDSLDSGTTWTCDKGHKIVVDVGSPEARTEHFVRHEALERENAALRKVAEAAATITTATDGGTVKLALKLCEKHIAALDAACPGWRER